MFDFFLIKQISYLVTHGVRKVPPSPVNTDKTTACDCQIKMMTFAQAI